VGICCHRQIRSWLKGPRQHLVPSWSKDQSKDQLVLGRPQWLEKWAVHRHSWKSYVTKNGQINASQVVGSCWARLQRSSLKAQWQVALGQQKVSLWRPLDNLRLLVHRDGHERIIDLNWLAKRLPKYSQVLHNHPWRSTRIKGRCWKREGSYWDACLKSKRLLCRFKKVLLFLTTISYFYSFFFLKIYLLIYLLCLCFIFL
jgi:hypothetical protein